MKIYLVGGAVRDRLLGLAVSDRDWVVVGATPEEMLELGYQRVGADFPVFLHPESREEYALARTERKTAAGHKGFETHFDVSVTLEEDLARRDLTINAIAQTEDGTLIDPYGGQRDLAAGVLRAVTDAFREDPLRVLRVARFAAQLPGFEVAPETLEMMRDMCARKALHELPGERVWQELRKALGAAEPGRFAEVVAAVDAWEPFLVELAEVAPVRLADGNACERFAAWLSPLSLAEVRRLCQRVKAPNAYRDFAVQVNRFAETVAGWRESPAEALTNAVQSSRGYHDATHLEPLFAYVQKRFEVDLTDLMKTVQETNEQVRAASFEEEGKALGEALFQARTEHIRQAQRLR